MKQAIFYQKTLWLKIEPPYQLVTIALLWETGELVPKVSSEIQMSLASIENIILKKKQF